MKEVFISFMIFTTSSIMLGMVVRSYYSTTRKWDAMASLDKVVREAEERVGKVRIKI